MTGNTYILYLKYPTCSLRTLRLVDMPPVIKGSALGAILINSSIEQMAETRSK